MSSSPSISTDNRIVTGPLRRTMLLLALPVLAEQLLNALVAQVDILLAGHLVGEYRELCAPATVAVGVAAYVGWLNSMLFALVGTGTTALVARACGAVDRRLANAVANQSLLLAGLMGLIGAAAMYFLAPHFATWLKLAPLPWQLTVQYLQIDAIGYAPWALTLVGSAALRGAGNMRTPLKVLACANVLNLILSPVLVYGIGPIPRCGVSGIVYGTLAARGLGGVLLIVVLLRGENHLKLRAALLRPMLPLIRRILRIGVPAAMDGALMWVANFLFLRIVGHLDQLADTGTNYAMAAQMVVVRLEAFTYLPAAAWAAASATMIGQALGADRIERARQCGRAGALQCGLLTAGVGTIFVLFSVRVCGLMNADVAVVAAAAPVLALVGFFQPALAVGITYSGALRGAGDTVFPMICNTAALGLVRLPFAYLLGVTWGWGFFGAWCAVCADMVLRMILLMVRFARGKWATIQV